jgi:TRAP-type C4-dicarboxylate transport system permease small subunit
MGISICVISFSLYTLNVLLSKYFSIAGQNTISFDRVPEFLMLFVTAISFTVAALAAEKRVLNAPKA